MARGSSDNFSTKAKDKAKGKVLSSTKEAPSLAATALDNFPKEAKDLRNEFIGHLDALISTAAEAAKAVGTHKKRLTSVFNTEPCVIKWLGDMRKLTPDRQAKAIRQFAFLLKPLEICEQLSLFNDVGEAGGLPLEPGDKPVFDATGNKAAPLSSDREHKPKLTGAEPPPHVPSEGIPLDEAKAKFEEAKAKGDAKRAAATPPVTKPPVTKPAKGEAKKAATAETVAASPPVKRPDGVRRTNREPTPAELEAVKNKADKYIPRAPASDEDPDEMPGNYRPH